MRHGSVLTRGKVALTTVRIRSGRKAPSPLTGGEQPVNATHSGRAIRRDLLLLEAEPVSLDALADALEPARASQHIGKRARVCGLARTISQPGSRRLLVEATGGPEPLLAANHDRPVVHPRSQLREHTSPKNHTSQQRLHDVTDFRGLHRGRRTHADSTPSQPTLPIGHRLALIVHRHQPRREVRAEAHQNWATRSGRATLTFRLRAINVPLRQASQGHSRPLGTEKLAKNQAQTP